MTPSSSDTPILEMEASREPVAVRNNTEYLKSLEWNDALRLFRVTLREFAVPATIPTLLAVSVMWKVLPSMCPLSKEIFGI